MRILFDTNVVLDVLLLREPFFRSAVNLLAEVERKHLEGFICSTTVTTIHYLVEKVKGSQEAKEQVENLLRLFKIAGVGRKELESALRSNISDFEDAVLYESGLSERVDGIVTRDGSDFKQSKLTIYNPDELLAILQANK